MSWLKRIFGKPPAQAGAIPALSAATSDEQCVLIKIVMAGEGFGGMSERERLYDLEDKLAKAIEESGCGEYDGNEIGEGAFVIYTYGPDADALWKAIAPVLGRVRVEMRQGSHAIKRYGPPGAREERVELGRNE